MKWKYHQLLLLIFSSLRAVLFVLQVGLFADPAYTDVSNTPLFNGLLPRRVTPTCLAYEAILTPTLAQITETKSASGFIYGVSYVPTMTGNIILTDFLTEQCCGFHWVICWTLSQINCSHAVLKHECVFNVKCTVHIMQNMYDTSTWAQLWFLCFLFVCFLFKAAWHFL